MNFVAVPAFPAAWPLVTCIHCRLRNSAMFPSVPEAESEMARILLMMTMIRNDQNGQGRMLDRLTARIKTKGARTTASVPSLTSSSMARCARKRCMCLASVSGNDFESKVFCLCPCLL